MIGAKSCICTVNELSFLFSKHAKQFFFQRKNRCLFAGVSGSDAHRNRESVCIHKQSHFYQRIWFVVFCQTILPKTGQNFSGNRIRILFVCGFGFTVVIGAVIIADCGITPQDFVAGSKKMCDVIIIIFCQKVHRAQNMLIIEIRFFEKGVHFFETPELGIRAKDSGISQKAVHKVRRKSEFSFFGFFL